MVVWVVHSLLGTGAGPVGYPAGAEVSAAGAELVAGTSGVSGT